MWTAASTGDHRGLLPRAGALLLLSLTLIVPGSATGDNGGDKKPPKNPANVVVVAASSSSVTLAWSASPAASERSAPAGFTIYQDTTVLGTTVEPSYRVDGLSCGKSYNLSVDAFDAAQNHSDRVPVAAATAACPPPVSDTQPPTAPGSLARTGADGTSIAIAWGRSTDNVGVTGYALFRNSQQVETTVDSSYTYTNLSCGTGYTLGVAAFDGAGNKSSTSQITASTAACALPKGDSLPPTTPGGLAATTADASSISISWAPSTDNVGVTGYAVSRDGSSVDTTTGTSYRFTGMPCGTAARLGIAAYDAAGNRSGTAEVTASTTACVSPTSTPIPTPTPTPPSANAFYVSPSGSDSNPGTLAAPWRTIGKAAATLSAGQTVYLRAGTYAENMDGPCSTSYNVVTLARSGSSDAPITFSGYPGEESNVIVKTKLRLTGNWLRLQNFVYDRNYAYASPVDLDCTGEPLHVIGDDIVITGLEIRNGNQSGIFLGGADRATITGNWIHDNGNHADADHGLYWSSGVGGTIANNVFERNKAYGIHMYPNPSGQLITENTVIGSGRAGVILSGAQNQTVVNNISVWNREEGIRTGSGGCSGCRADRNLLFGNSADYYFETPLTVGSTLHADPGFVNRAAGNYRLASGSPAADVALAQYAMQVDFTGGSRPVGPGPDVGAFERR